MRLRLNGLGVVCFGLMWMGGASVLGFQAPKEPRLPNFDVRRDAARHGTAPDGPRREALGQLARRVPDAQVEWDDLLGSPRWITTRHGFLSGPRGEGRALSEATVRALPSADPHRAVKAFLTEHAGLFGHGAEALAAARRQRDYVTAHNGLRTTVWEQQHEGISVFQGLLVAHVTKDGELVSLSSRLVPDLTEAVRRGHPGRGEREVEPVLSAAQALVLAAQNIGEILTPEQLTALPPRAQGRAGALRFTAPALLGEAEARLVWLPLDRHTLRLCWEVILKSRQRREAFRVLVDAETGDALARRCLTMHLSDATYRVFTSDSPSPFSPGHSVPSTNQPPVVTRTLVTLGALDTNASPLGWITDGVNETRGNNVEAHLDRNGDDVPDLPRPQGAGGRVFDFPLDLALHPTNYSAAAVVQLFYWNNWMHDRLYGLGFTEAAGNFQNTNFSRGGVEGDAVLADAQDGSGFNNAMFDAMPDGVPGRMEMFLFTTPTPARDGDLDAEVILHEYTHGLTDRLVGGGAGIEAQQSLGLSEGWSDFYALALLSEPADNVDGNYPLGGYVTYRSATSQNYYFGIRRYPYSTDLSKSPLTFRDIDMFQVNSHPGVPRNPNAPSTPGQEHNVGEVWCAMLWEARANLIRKHGFAVGNELILQLVTDSLKLLPPDPTFTQARDAIVLADRVKTGGQNFYELWGAFAKRGLGASALAPPNNSTVGLREAFDLPDILGIEPLSGFTAVGPAGGPFGPTTQTLTLTNLGSNTLVWSAAWTSSWLSLSQTGGTLTVGGTSATVVVSLTPAAEALPMGIYTDSVRFTNLTTGASQRANYTLRVGQPDYFTELFDQNDHDLDNVTFTFTPDGSVSFYSVCREAATNFPTDPAGGTALALTDDSFETITVADGRRVSLYGTDANVFFVGSNGYLTWGSGDKATGEAFDKHFDRPRVSALFDDLNPAAGGAVSWKQLSNRVAVTYVNVPEYGTTNRNNFQIELFFDGTIRLTYLRVDARDALVGLSAGGGVPAGFLESDFSAFPFCTDPVLVALPNWATEGDGALIGTGLVTLPRVTTTNIAVRLTSADPSEITVPATVPVLAGQSNATFDVTIVDDAVLDGTQITAVIAAASGYNRGTNTLTVFDNESAQLSVTVPTNTIEGVGSEQGIVSVNAPPAKNVRVELGTSYTDEIQVPAAVVIPAGQTSAVFTVTVFDDPLVDGPQSVGITAHVQNWQDGTGVMTVFDNEDALLRVGLPAQAFEDDGVLAGAGVVRLSGILPTNLTVSLTSDHPANLSVPATVLIPAGLTSAVFNVTLVDNAFANPSLAVTVTASAAGFTDGSGTVTVLDDETPAVPVNPSPPHLATNVPVTTDLAWRVPERELIVNGGFETGDFTGWTREDTGAGAFVINDGAFNPTSPDGPLPPFAGSYGALSEQTGPGRHVLYQDIILPGGAGPVALRWAQRIRNHTSGYASNHYFRVEVRSLTNGVLAVAFATNPGDIVLSVWEQRTFDLSAFRGQRVRVAFVEEDNASYLNVHLDDVSVQLVSEESPVYDVYLGVSPGLGPAQFVGSTSNTFLDVPALVPLTTYFWQVVARGVGQSTSAVWQFTTRGPDHFEWSLVPSPQRQSLPFGVTVTAKDELNRTVTNFTGPVTLDARVEVPDTSVGEGSANSAYPLAASFHDARSQVIYLASELGGPQRIAALSLDLVTPPGQTLTNWTIRMKHTTLSSYAPDGSPGWDAAGWTVVHQRNAAVTNEGWVTFTFNAPFDYDGTNNLLVDFSFNNSSSSTDGICSATDTPERRMLQYRTDSRYGDPLAWSGLTPTPFVSNLVFDLLLTPFKPSVPLTPATSGTFTGGVWSGNVMVGQPAAELTLGATDSAGYSGRSNPFSVLPNDDRDGDGIPNSWEESYELDPDNPDDGPLDLDGDGHTNLEEFRAGTSPLNPESVLRITALDWNGATVQVSFKTAPTKRYRLERATDPAGPWTPVGTVVQGTGAIVPATDSGAAGQRFLFYRVTVVP